MSDKRIKWVAKWEEEDITIASAPTRRELALNLNNYLKEHLHLMKGTQFTIAIDEVTK